VRVEAEWHRMTSVALVRPTNFWVADPVNETQRHFYGSQSQPHPDRLLAQHDAVRHALLAEGIEVVDVPPPPDAPLAFNVRDAGAVIGSTLMLGRMGRSVRACEPAWLAADLGVVASAPDTGVFEGGDVNVTPDQVFVGIGERTDLKGCASLATMTRQVVRIPLSPGVLHLDVALNLLGPSLGVLHRPALAGAAPEGFTWIEITEDEFLEQAANILVLGPHCVMMDSRHTRLEHLLNGHGYTCILVELDEITKVGGGVRCMTLPLTRTPT
jgi:N-dimethylarginine dimethylaminohydrolase